MKKLILCALSLFTMTCCIHKQTQITQIDFSFGKSTKQKISDDVVNYSIVLLETKPESYLTSASKIKILGEKIFIQENIIGKRDQIFIFNSKGEFVAKIISQGRGPTEYTSISDFDVDTTNKIISVLDPGLRKLISYDFSSVYKSEKKFDCYAKEFRYLRGPKLYKVFATNMSKKIGGEGNMIYVYDMNDNLVYSSLQFEKPVGIILGNATHLISTTDGISYLKPNSPFIYKVGSDSTTIRYKLNFSFDVLPEKDINKVFIEGKVDALRKYVYNINYFESSNTIFTQFMHNKKVYIGLYGKQSKIPMIFEEQKDPSCGCGVTINIKGAVNNSFILESDYTKIDRVINMIDPEHTKCLNTEVFEAIRTLEMVSNPILLLVEFKI